MSRKKEQKMNKKNRKKIKLRKDQKLNEFILLSNILTTWSLSFKDGINFFSFP